MGTRRHKDQRQARVKVTNQGKREQLNAYERSQICAIIAVGCSRDCAANYIGCSVATIERLVARSKSFAAKLAAAESQNEITHLENIRAAGKKEWRASAWALERRYPERYGPRKPKSLTSAQVTNVLSEFATLVLETTSDAELRERLQTQLNEMLQELDHLMGTRS